MNSVSVVNPGIARKGVYIDSFTNYQQAVKTGINLQKILKSRKQEGDIVLTIITSGKGVPGSPKFSYQLYWLRLS